MLLLKSNHNVTRNLSSKQRRFGTIAAAFVAALLVGTLILVLYQARQSRAGGTGVPLDQEEAIVLLHMIDATTGWAVTQKAVLRTTDSPGSM